MSISGCNAIFGIDERSVAAPPREEDAAATAATPIDSSTTDSATTPDSGSSMGPCGGQTCTGSTPICSAGGAARTCVGVASVAFGPADGHACAVLTDGTVRCWGESDHGRLGAGNVAKTGPSSPVAALDLDKVTSITLGARHTCALREKEVWCWGSNDNGQVNGTPGPSILTATKVALPSNLAGQVNVVSAGHEHTCASSDSGDVVCWGRNTEGQLGAGDFTARPGFFAVSFTSAVALCGGLYHSCAASSSKIVCWGDRTQVKLGNAMASGPSVASVRFQFFPIGMPDIPNIVSLSCGTSHTCALDSLGSAVCWGANESGQLGLGNTTIQDYALRPTPLKDSDRLAVGDGFTCVTSRDDHLLRCAGRNDLGQLGDGTFTTTRIPLATATGVGTATMLGTSRRHSCALGDGGLRCWGDNTSGQLGRPTPEPRSAIGASPSF
jgi:alpha-tubulin suppressor-like RCC1 family protein